MISESRNLFKVVLSCVFRRKTFYSDTLKESVQSLVIESIPIRQFISKYIGLFDYAQLILVKMIVNIT